jgi:hypothetical protein
MLNVAACRLRRKALSEVRSKKAGGGTQGVSALSRLDATKERLRWVFEETDRTL